MSELSTTTHILITILLGGAGAACLIGAELRWPEKQMPPGTDPSTILRETPGANRKLAVTAAGFLTMAYGILYGGLYLAYLWHTTPYPG